MPRVTLKMIAKEAGVSVSTVSMALRGQGKFDKDNVARIRAAADRLGYKPDPVLASLASRRFRSGEQSEGHHLALLEFPSFGGETAASVSQYRECLLAHGRELGYAPYVYSTDEMRRYQDFSRLLYHRGTAAVVVTGQPFPDLFEQQAHWDAFALAQCGRYRAILPLHTVRPNIFQAIQLSFRMARERGYCRIGFALGHHAEVLEDDMARYGAALAFIRQNLEPKDRIEPFFGYLNDMDGIVKWALKHRPDAVIGFSAGVWYALKDAGIRAPEDIGFICLHKPLAQDEGDLRLSGLDQARESIARQALLLLDQNVRHGERGIPKHPRNILIPSTWVEGDTLPAREAAESAEKVR
jgi:LacI family transcriptional regulator